MSGLISYDELVAAPVLITPIRKVPADDDRDLSAPVGRGRKIFTVREWTLQRSLHQRTSIYSLNNERKLYVQGRCIILQSITYDSSYTISTYLSSFIAICKGSVSPSSSTMTGAHMLLEEDRQVE